MDFKELNESELIALKEYMHNVVDFVVLNRDFAKRIGAEPTKEFNCGADSILRILMGDIRTIEDILEERL